MSLLDEDVGMNVRVTREWLQDNGWEPTSKSGRSWRKRNIKFTNGHDSFVAYVSFKYTIRDPHTKVRNHLYCMGPFWVEDEDFGDVKTVLDLNSYMGAYMAKARSATETGKKEGEALFHSSFIHTPAPSQKKYWYPLR